MGLTGGRNPGLPAGRSAGTAGAAAILGGSVVLVIGATALTSCETGAGQGPQASTLTEVTASPTTIAVLAGPPDVVAAAAAARLCASAPVVVLANAERTADLSVAADRARRSHAPLLLVSAGAGPAQIGSGRRSGTKTSALVLVRTELSALHARAIPALGVA